MAGDDPSWYVQAQFRIGYLVNNAPADHVVYDAISSVQHFSNVLVCKLPTYLCILMHRYIASEKVKGDFKSSGLKCDGNTLVFYTYIQGFFSIYNFKQVCLCASM